MGYSFVATLIIALVLNVVFRKMRMTEDAQLEGMDAVLHGESAYEFGPSLGTSVGTLTGSGAAASGGHSGGSHASIPASGRPVDGTSLGSKTGVDA